MKLPAQAQRAPLARAGWLGVALLALALQGCGRGADSGATANPNAPGQPGSAGTSEVVRPAPDSPAESPQIGGSTEQVPAGITGSGGPAKLPGEMQDQAHVPQQPGAGLHGGLGGDASTILGSAPANTATSAPGGEGITRGSTNATPGGAVGQR